MSDKKSTAVKETGKPAESAGLTANAEKNSVPKKKAAGNNADGFCVYIGPSIMGVIQSGTVYRGEKKDVLKTIASAIEKYPLISSLVVSDKTLSEDRIKVNTPGNLLYVNYHKLIKGKK